MRSAKVVEELGGLSVLISCTAVPATDVHATLSGKVKGQRVVSPSPLATFPALSVDKFADQFQNGNQRICTCDDCPQNDD